MLKTTFITIICALCVSVTAIAEIEEWGPATSGFVIYDDDTVKITAAGTYYFQAYDGDTATDINNIYITEGGIGGTVTIHIYQDPNDANGVGAANVKQIDLSGATTGIIARLYISGNLATQGHINCTNITGNIEVDGSLGIHRDSHLLSSLSRSASPLLVCPRTRASMFANNR